MKTYSPTTEVVAAWLSGVIGFIVILAVLALFQIFEPNGFMSNSFEKFEDSGFGAAVENSVVGFGRLFLLLVALAVAIGVISLPQLLFLALPLAYYLSQGLECDANRGGLYYMAVGGLIGGGPWLCWTYLYFGSNVDLGSLVLFTGPGTLVGIIAGASLKYWLLKLSKAQKRVKI